MIHLDFETRSEADLKVVGPWEYSLHPSTEVLCLAFSRGRLWYPREIREAYPLLISTDKLPDPEAGIFAAFNVGFEYSIWNNIMVPRYGASKLLDFSRWSCTAARAKSFSLPSKLEDVATALKLGVEKSKEGHRLMLSMCKPRKPTKNDPSVWRESHEDLKALGDYCLKDVEVETAIEAALPPEEPREREIWVVDQIVNQRGFMVDIPTVDKAINVLALAGEDASAELASLTDGAVTAPSQVARILSWCSDQSYHLPSLARDDLETALEDEDMPEVVRAVLELRLEHSLASVKKYIAMKEGANKDDHRLRQTLRYCGAGRTRRWSGQRVQPQNFVKGFEDLSDIEFVFKHLDYPEMIKLFYGALTGPISKSLRGAIVAKPGHKLVVCDFSGIEARLTAALSGCSTMLEAFVKKLDPYKVAATSIYKVPYNEVNKEQRFFGKQAVLGLGYGMGAKKYLETCAKYGKQIELGFSQNIVTTFRESFSEIPRLWKQIEHDALYTLSTGKPVTRSGYGFEVNKYGLVMTLPNGSLRYYLGAAIRSEEKFGKIGSAISYFGSNQTTGRWERQFTYGGKLVENLVQGTARELQADAFVALERGGFNPILQVHDEIVCELPEDGPLGIADVRKVMCTSSPWAAKWPIDASGYEGKRYKK